MDNWNDVICCQDQSEQVTLLYLTMSAQCDISYSSKVGKTGLKIIKSVNAACACLPWNSKATVFIRVCMYTGDVINSLC